MSSASLTRIALASCFATTLSIPLTLAQPAQSPQSTSPPVSSATKTNAKTAFMREQALKALIEKERPAIDERRKKIETELASTEPGRVPNANWVQEWAGRYYTGDGTGMNVSIMLAPKSGLVYTWHGCMGLYDANHGDIVESTLTYVRVKLAIDPELSSFEYLSEKLFFVPWGDRRYLVPESRILQIVNDYNEGGHARVNSMGSMPRRVKTGEYARARTPEPPGRPLMPQPYAKLIIDMPMRLKVTNVSTKTDNEVTTKVKTSESRVILEGGRNQNVSIGMDILYSRGRSLGVIKIDKVDDKTSEGALTLFGGINEEFEAPPVGTELVFPGAMPEFVFPPK